jgi:hypothetical protein
MPRSDKGVHARLGGKQKGVHARLGGKQKGVHARLHAKCQLICIDPARINEFWPHVAPLIKAAMVRGAITDFTDVEDAVFARRALVWIAWNGTALKAAAVTQLSTVHGERFCTIVACASGRLRPSSRAMGQDRSEWLPLLAGLERYAKSENCQAIRIFGRRGWERLLPDYRPARVLLQKELT